MPPLDHWHPVMLAERLGARPASVRACDRELVVFRDGAGRVGALADRCPHRGMRLSTGWVEGGRLVCPYHAWSFDVAGAGASPATPQVRICADALEACERHGAIWVRRAGAASAFPEVDAPGHDPVCVLQHRIEAPLEPVLDNFTEVEHTPTTHALFGYSREALPEIETKVELRDDSVRVFNSGPQKKLGWLVRFATGIRQGDRFVDEWTTRFSPVHTIYDQWWSGPGGEPRSARVRFVVFFVPVTEGRTELFTFASAPPDAWNRFGLRRIFMNRLLRRLVDHEVMLDRRMVEALADKRPEIDNRSLGRFDLPLVENRKRIARIYRNDGDDDAVGA